MLFSVLFLTSYSIPQYSQADKDSFKIIGYYSLFGVTLAPPQVMDYKSLTYIIHFNINPSSTNPYFGPLVSSAESLNIEFSNIYAGNLNTPVQRILIDSSHKYNGKVLLGIAATMYNSTAYTQMDFITQDSARCDTFVRAYVSYLNRKGYDGADINWEFPSSAQKNNYMRMMRLFRKYLNNLGTYKGIVLGNGGRGILTQTSYPYNRPTAATQWFNPTELDTLIDFIMPEMYTLGVGQMNSYQGYGCGLYKSNCTIYDAHILAESTYQGGYGGPIGISKMGINRKRIAPGLGFEKYLYRNVTGVCQTPGQAWDGGNFNYQMVENPTVGYGLKPEFWDNAAKVHYKTWNDAGTNYFLTYEDSTSLAIKVAWIKQQGFGGVMLYCLNEGYISAVNVYGGMSSYSGDRQKLLHSVAKAAWGTNPSPPITPLTINLSVNTNPQLGKQVLFTVSTNKTVDYVTFLRNEYFVRNDSSIPYTNYWTPTVIGGYQIKAVAHLGIDSVISNTLSYVIVDTVMPPVYCDTAYNRGKIDGIASIDTFAIRMRGWNLGYLQGYNVGVLSVNVDSLSLDWYQTGYTVAQDSMNVVMYNKISEAYLSGYTTGNSDGYTKGFSARPLIHDTLYIQTPMIQDSILLSPYLKIYYWKPKN